MEDLFLENPDYDDYLVMDKPRRKRRRSNPATAEGGGLFLMLTLGFGGWLLWYKNKNGRFPWQPVPVPPPAVQQRLAAQAITAKRNQPAGAISESYKVIMPRNEKYDGEGFAIIMP
jgi:hypothetical protein